MSKKPQQFTMAEVEKHSTLKDRWIVIDDKIYDVTSYLSKHPGGEELLLEKKDGSSDLTSSFEEIGHSTDARETMKTFYVGDVKKVPAYTYEEVNAHNKEGDKWLAIEGKVYDVSAYTKEHPGGPEVLLSGHDDMTSAFQDIGHSAGAKEILAKLYVGDVKGYIAPTERKSSLPIAQILIVFLIAIIAYLYTNLPNDASATVTDL